ncbi:hypothetical protein CEXT_217871 [Caerostris extrusa]|uniref:Uncharacterized protein n=1 Tax=Caerostris extrusa TaxID=172846 RepID=A0AAV4XCL3_CAEEX|nr:hypothetical protein CEXT_217871 [Caerostris extrusa]
MHLYCYQSPLNCVMAASQSAAENAINMTSSTKLFFKSGHNHQAHEKAIPSYLITFSLETRELLLRHDVKPFVDPPSTKTVDLLSVSFPFR